MQERMQEKMQEKIRQNVSNIGNMENTTNMTNTMNMTNVTSLEEDVKALAASGEYRRVPVCRELFSDLCTPLEALRASDAGAATACWRALEESRQWGRYTFLGIWTRPWS